MNPAMPSQNPASIKKGDKQPEYTKYRSMKHFFNQKRAELVKTMPSHHPFRQRIKRGTRGHRILPFPISQPRLLRSAKEVATEKKRKINTKYLTTSNPGWCLRRRQLIEMWNKEPYTMRQWKDRVRAGPKMEALVNEFQLKKVVNEGAQRRLPSRWEAMRGRMAGARSQQRQELTTSNEPDSDGLTTTRSHRRR